MKQWRKVQKGVVCLLVISILALHLQGCASQTATGTGVGAGIGAVVGAAIGAAVGGKKGALIGGGAGAVLGAALGYAYTVHVAQGRSVKDYQTTKTETGYEPAQGEVIKITSYTLQPAAVSPGQEISIKATYLVMTPNPEREIAVTESWSLSKFRKDKDQLVLDTVKEVPPSAVTVKPGTRLVEGTIPLTGSPPEGDYALGLKVARDGQSDARSLRFAVTTDVAKLNAPGSKTAQFTAPPLATLGERQPTAPSPALSQRAQGATQSFVASKLMGQGNVRDGPGKDYKVVASIQAGDRFPLLNSVKSAKEAWHKIRLEDGREAWVHGGLGVVE